MKGFNTRTPKYVGGDNQKGDPDDPNVDTVVESGIAGPKCKKMHPYRESLQFFKQRLS